MTISEKKDDIFMLQVRLYRMLQTRKELTAEECNKIFDKYKLFEYIELCYEIYRVQGDEANYNDVVGYLEVQGF